jgi:hypothetical protein
MATRIAPAVIDQNNQDCEPSKKENLAQTKTRNKKIVTSKDGRIHPFQVNGLDFDCDGFNFRTILFGLSSVTIMVAILPLKVTTIF